MNSQILRYTIYVLCLTFLDQITKAILSARDFFFLGMHFHLVKNSGLSFGLNFGNPFNSIIILLALILFVIYIPKNLLSKKIKLGIVLVISGALSNVADRIIFGFVRDFWDLNLGFTFNLADLFIIVGIILLFTSNQEQLVE
jgi:signal peptidase II